MGSVSHLFDSFSWHDFLIIAFRIGSVRHAFACTLNPARTRVARVFPNEAALLRLITALLCETNDDWETGKIYLNMENQPQPSV